jgi:hypothetical protein
MSSQVQTSIALRLILGFVAGILAVAIFHQLMVFVLGQTGLIPGGVYSMKAVDPLGVPTIVSQMFWGGVWGVVYALIADRLFATWPLVLAGLVFGLLGPVLFGWTLVAFLKGNALFGGWNPTRMLASVLINGCFAIGLALIYTGLRRLAAGSAHGLPA